MQSRKASPLLELALVLVRLDHVASDHLDDLGGSDFYLYTNLPGARLRDLCSPSHLLRQRGAKGVVMRITKAVADLWQQIHDDLRRQHPEWVLTNGESPMCDAYEARLMELLEPSAPPLSLRGGKRPSKWRLNYERFDY